MLLCILPSNVFAVSYIKELHATVTQPEIGQKPAKVKLPADSRFEVTETKWSGGFDNGTFKVGESYTVTYKVKFKNYKDVVNYRLNIKEGRDVTLNGNQVKITSHDKIENATLQYTFPALIEDAAPVVPTGPIEHKTLTKEYSSAIPDSTFTEEAVEIEGQLRFTVPTPIAGKTLNPEASTENPDLEITKVILEGDFNPDGTCIAGDSYKFIVYFKIKGNVNKILPIQVAKMDATVNGAEKSYYVSDRTVRKTAYLIVTIEAPHEKTHVDFSKMYSLEYADSCNWEAHPKLQVISDGDAAYNYVTHGAPDVDAPDYVPDYSESITSIIVDTSEHVINSFMEDGSNLNEVWLSPKVNVTQFIGEHAANGPAYQFLYAWKDSAAQKWAFKLYVPEEKLSEIQQLFADNPNNRMRWFETVVYKGNDVYAAYEKKQAGEDISIPWCTNHVYDYTITTADRVMIEQDCAHTRWFCYSCRICGKPEMNPYHMFSQNELIPPITLSDSTGRMTHIFGYTPSNLIKAENFVGMNTEGEYVYQKSCLNCGMKAYDAHIYKEYELYSYLDPTIYFGSMEEYHRSVEVQKKSWNDIQIPAALKANVGDGGYDNDTVYAFAVKSAPVSAVFSSWAENELNWAKEKGLITDELLGNNYTRNINRQQFCSVAVKLAEKLLEQEIAPAPSGTFFDTDDIYVRKAYAAGITSGTGAGQFSPYDTLTRQQMATFIYRALQYVKNNSGIRYTVYTPNLERYTDNWEIQDWAREPLGFMNALGLVKGISDTAISPNGTCTIEQAIVVAYRSLSAPDIGWYQVKRSTYMTNLGGAMLNANLTQYILEDSEDTTGDTMTQATVESGDRIWVTNVVRSYSKTESGWLETTHPYFPERRAWISGNYFLPIKDLSAEDLALYNAQLKPYYEKK